MFAVNLFSMAIHFSALELPKSYSRVIFVTVLILAFVWPLLVLITPKRSFFKVSLQPSSRSTEAQDKTTETDSIASYQRPGDRDWQGTILQIKKSQIYLEPDLTLVQLAKALGTNRATLSNLINSATGTNFNTFINTLRLDHAKDRLRRSTVPVLDIAFDAGFSSKATFNRVFRKHEGCTPSAYRNAEP